MKIENLSIQLAGLLVPTPDERWQEWISYQDQVVFVLSVNGRSVIRTGHVTSRPGSHGIGWEIDNISKTVIWCDQILNDLADNADDASEICFEVKNPRLLRRDEVYALKDPRVAVIWFKGVFSAREAYRISRFLSKPDLGASNEEKGRFGRWEKASHTMDENLKHWQEHGCPHPVYGNFKRRCH